MKLNKRPKINVFMLTYNQEMLVVDSIDSIINQTYTNWELLIGDDCSTDNTVKIIEKYTDLYPEKIKLIKNNINLGITGNCNNLIKYCDGDYIVFIGGDDLFFPNKIKSQIEFMLKFPECSMSYHNVEVFDKSKNKVLWLQNNKKNTFDGDVSVVIKEGCFFAAQSVMVRNDRRIRYEPTIKIASDWLSFVEYLAQGGKIMYLNEILGQYVKHGNNTTIINKDNSNLDHVKSCEYLLENYPQYSKEINYRYSFTLRTSRKTLPYFQTLVKSLKIRLSFKVIIMLFVFIFTFGKIKI